MQELTRKLGSKQKKVKYLEDDLQDHKTKLEQARAQCSETQADARARGHSSDLLLLVLQKCDFLTLLYELCSNDRFEVPISARKCDFERFKSFRFPSPYGEGKTVAFDTFECSLL